MSENDHVAPEGYRFPFPTREDAYSFEDFQEDCTHLDTLAGTGVELRQIVNLYFDAHYPPLDRAQRCLNLFWSIEAFLTREARRAHAPEIRDSWPRFERGTRAAWQYYSSCRYGDVITDDMAIVEVTNILLDEDQ
jgi:hypothetical protein